MKEEKMKDKEIWMARLKEKLDDYSEPLPDFGWERLEKELAPPIVEKRILYPYRRWTVAAAVVALLIISSVSVYFLHTPVADEVRYAKVPELPASPDQLPQTLVPAKKVTLIEPAKNTYPVVASVHKYKQEQGAESLASAENTIKSEIGKEIAPESEGAETIKKEKSEVKEEHTAVRPHRPSAKDKLHLPVETSSKKSGRWSLGAAVGNAGSTLISANGMDGSERERLSLISDPDEGTIPIPNDGRIIVFEDGVPYLQRLEEVVDVKHHQPISFGLSIRKGLRKGFSIETGVTYTLLSSDVRMLGVETRLSQKLHYIGIPVRANWNFLDKKRFTLYLSGGAMVEKCVYGKLGGEKLTIDPLQFSISGAVGAQFNATSHVGLYVEPGVAYFFNDGSDFQTIRKETPCNFNIQAGIRFTY